MKSYPLISAVVKRDRNTQAKCKCGAVAKFRTEVQISYMRGDDEYFWSCDAHKKDLEYLFPQNPL